MTLTVHQLQKIVIDIFVKQFPDLSVYTITDVCRKNNYDKDKVREELKSINRCNEITDFLAYLRRRYHTTQDAIKHQIYHNLGKHHITDLTDEDLTELESRCKKIWNEKVYNKKIHELCSELHLNFQNVTSIVSRKLYKEKGIKKSKSDIVKDGELANIENFIRTTYVNELAKGPKAKGYKFDISPYKKLPDVHKAYKYVDLSTVYYFYKLSDSREEFFKRIEEHNEYKKSYATKKNIIKEKKLYFANKYKLHIKTVDRLISSSKHLSLSDAAIMEDLSLLDIIERYISQYVKNM